MPGILRQGDQPRNGGDRIVFPFLSPSKKHEKAVGDKAGRRGEGEGPVGGRVSFGGQALSGRTKGSG